MKPPALRFILMHGTWAREAAWTKNPSFLRASLAKFSQACGRDSSFLTPQWSGDNRFYSRKIASERIKAQIDLIGSDEEIFVVGHSHGGSAVAYFLKDNAEYVGRISGIIFMSTPFVSFRVSPKLAKMIASTMVFLGIIMYPVLAISISIFLFIFDFFPERYNLTSYLLVSMLSGAISAYFVYVSLKRVVSRAREAKWRARNFIRNFDACSFPGVEKSYFVRVTGDEAAASLAFAQFLAWIASLVGGYVGRKLISIYRLYNSISKNPATLGLFIFVYVLFHMWLIAYVDLCFKWGTVMFFPWEVLEGSYVDFLFFQSTILSNIIVNSALVTVPFVLMAIFWLTLLLLTGFTQYLARLFAIRAFGVWAPVGAILVDCAVEPLPYGTNTLEHANWSEERSRIRTLNHSRTYDSEPAVSCMLKWIESKIKVGAS